MSTDSNKVKFITGENFEDLLKEYENDSQRLEEGSVVKGVIVEIGDKVVAVDIGAKAIGYVAVNEFRADMPIEVGDVVDILLERLENKKGELVLSRNNARRYTSWFYLKDCLEDKTIIDGKVLGKVKGGFAVDVNGITSFLPKSQVDTMLLVDPDDLVGKTERFVVLKIDDVRGNVVVSRRAILEEERSKEREKIMSTIAVGDVLEGIVKNITDYGAFIDFGSFDGLLHLTDISWCRVRHPSEILKLGERVKVQVIKFDPETNRVSLGMKQLYENPWATIKERYPVGQVVKGHVTNIAQYGIFVEIENGIEGLVHVSEISWLKNNININKMFEPGQEVEIMILDIDPENHRISLGMKQCEENPWQKFAEEHEVGDILEGIVKNVTEFGLFVGFDSGVDGLVHVSDISWDSDSPELLKDYKKDDKVKVMLLGTSYDKERISLGIKHLAKRDEICGEFDKIEKGSVLPCVVLNVKKDFLEVELEMGLKAVIKRTELSHDKRKQKTESFEPGDKLEAKVTFINKKTGKIMMSVKEMEEEETESNMKKYGNSSNAGSTNLGTILSNALEEAEKEAEEELEE